MKISDRIEVMEKMISAVEEASLSELGGAVDSIFWSRRDLAILV
jgi:hypothetical protein